MYYPTSDRPSATFGLRQARYRHAAATTQSGRTLLSGGRRSVGEYPLTATAFLQGTQEMDAPALPHPRDGHGSAAVDETIFVLGGGDGQKQLSSCLALKGQTWTNIRSMNTSRYSFVSIAAPKSSGQMNIFAVGGWDGSPIPIVEVYNTGTDKWTTTTPLPLALSYLAGVYSDGKVYVCGGKVKLYSDSAVASMYSLDPRVGKWEEETPMKIRRFAHCVVPINGSIFVLGGTDSSATALSKVEVYEPRNKTWADAKDLQLLAVRSTATLDLS